MLANGTAPATGMSPMVMGGTDSNSMPVFIWAACCSDCSCDGVSVWISFDRTVQSVYPDEA